MKILVPPSRPSPISKVMPVGRFPPVGAGKRRGELLTRRLSAVGSANKTWFNSYHAYSDHLQFLSDLQSQFPANTEIVSSGKSLNGNAITGIHIFGSAGKGKRPAVVFHGTVHAREWISTMVGGENKTRLSRPAADA